jgi:transcription elongation GreA/GreB family factor
MKGIYLTEQSKQEIEAKIVELETIRNESSSDNNDYYLGRLKELEEILSSATILPVEKSLNDIPISVLMAKQNLSEYYPNGVIIQPKQ